MISDGGRHSTGDPSPNEDAPLIAPVPPDRVPAPIVGGGSIWLNRPFMLLWLAQAISQTAQNAVWYGLMVLVQTRSHSSAHMSVAVMTVILPSVIFGLVAGAYVDRRDKRLVLFGTNALRAVVMFAYVLFSDHLALVYLANFVFSTIGQFFDPAEAAMIPAIVHRRQLIQANSLFHITFTASQLGGLVLLGPLIVNLLGVDALFVLVAISLLVCAVLVWPLPSTRRRIQEPTIGFGGLVGEVRDVLRMVSKDRGLTWAMSQWTLGSTLAIIIATLAPGFVVDVLGIRAEDSVFVLAPAGIGMVLGAAILSRLGDRVDGLILITVGMSALGASLSLLGVVEPLWAWMLGTPTIHTAPPTTGHFLSLVGIVMVIATLAGFAFVAVVVPSQTIIQQRTPTEVRGRVFAAQLVVSNVVGILPLLFLGELADLIGADRAMLVLGLSVLIFGLATARQVTAESLGIREGVEPSDSAA